MSTLILLVLAGTAIAGPLIQRQEYTNITGASEFPTLGQTLSINGQPYVGIQSDSVVDIYDFAEAYCADWSQPGDINKPQVSIEMLGTGTAFLKLNYTSHVNHCIHTEPRVVSKMKMRYCNSGDVGTSKFEVHAYEQHSFFAGIPKNDNLACTITDKLTTTDTDTQRYGYKVGLSMKLKAGIPLFGETEITANAEQSSDWTFTHTTTTEETYTVPLKLGQRCALTSIQFNTRCDTFITPQIFAVYEKNGQLKHPDITNICADFATVAARESYLRGQGFETSLRKVAQICDSTIPTNPGGNVQLDMSEAGNTIVVQGCAFR